MYRSTAKLFKKRRGGAGHCTLNSGYAVEYELLRKELLAADLTQSRCWPMRGWQTTTAALRINAELLPPATN